MEAGFGASSQRPVSIANSIPQNLQPTQSHALKLSTEEEMSLAHSLKSMGFMGNGYVLASEPVAVSVPFQQPVSGSTSGMVFSPTKAPEAMLPFNVDAISSSGAIANGLTVKTSSNLPTGIRKNLVSRPVRHLGPPPAFSPVPPKIVNESIYVSDSMSENLQWTLQLSPPMQLQGEKQKSRQDFQMLDDLKLHHEMQLQQQLVNGNQHLTPQPE
ncbi:hypothetical protein ACE6H2_023489 [Prunus campanulata]